MSFFDSKQEILNLELTTYGRYLLSKGKFMPIYYSFFDDEILYDSSYANLTESQNEIQERIINLTPVNKVQHNFIGVEENFSNNPNLRTSDINIEKQDLIQHPSQKNYALNLPLGNSSNNSEYAPAWRIKFLNGFIASSNQYIDNTDGTEKSLQPYLKIPQINLKDPLVEVLIQKNREELPNPYVLIDSVNSTEGDTIYAGMKSDFLLFGVNEENTNNLRENFDIELFIEEQDGQEKIWKPLQFFKPTNYIKNNILLDEPEKFLNIFEVDISRNDNYIDHFFEILVDEEIELPPNIKFTDAFKDLYAPDKDPEAQGPFGSDCPPGVDC